MDSYIDNRSMDELVSSTEPNEKYDFIVEDIFRDKDYGWQLNYYNDFNTSYDSQIARLNAETKECKADIESNTKLLEKIDADVKNARANPSTKHLQNQAKISLSLYAGAVDAIAEDNRTLEKNAFTLENLTWLQYVESSQTKSLRYFRNKFKKDDDLDYMKRGVTWACSYASVLRQNQEQETISQERTVS